MSFSKYPCKKETLPETLWNKPIWVTHQTEVQVSRDCPGLKIFISRAELIKFGLYSQPYLRLSAWFIRPTVRITIRLKGPMEEQILLFVTLTYSTCWCFRSSWNSATVFPPSLFYEAEKKKMLSQINDNSSTVSFFNTLVVFW